MNFIGRSKFRNTKSRQDAKSRRKRILMNVNALQSGPYRSPSDEANTHPERNALMDEMDCEVFSLFNKGMFTPVRASKPGEKDATLSDATSTLFAYRSASISESCSSEPKDLPKWEVHAMLTAPLVTPDAQAIPSNWTMSTSTARESGSLIDVWNKILEHEEKIEKLTNCFDHCVNAIKELSSRLEYETGRAAELPNSVQSEG